MKNLVWEEVAPYGMMSVPKRSRWDLPDLMGEVSEYFECGATVDAGDTVFDVGANVGAFAIEVARRAESDVSLFCFEPVPPIFSALSANARENTWLGRARTHLFEKAVVSEGDPAHTDLAFFRRFPTDSTCDIDEKRRDFEMFFAQKGSAFRDALTPRVGKTVAAAVGQLVTTMPQGGLGRAVSDIVTGHVRMRAPTTTLSAVVQERGVTTVDLLKIDVEGAELRVLQGISDAHWPLIRQIVLEGHDRDGRLDVIGGLLTEKGFDIAHLTQPEGADEKGLDSFLLYARRPKSGGNGHA